MSNFVLINLVQFRMDFFPGIHDVFTQNILRNLLHSGQVDIVDIGRFTFFLLKSRNPSISSVNLISVNIFLTSSLQEEIKVIPDDQQHPRQGGGEYENQQRSERGIRPALRQPCHAQRRGRQNATESALLNQPAINQIVIKLEVKVLNSHNIHLEISRVEVLTLNNNI